MLEYVPAAQAEQAETPARTNSNDPIYYYESMIINVITESKNAPLYLDYTLRMKGSVSVLRVLVC
jgi:hypothetical protein